MNIEIIGSLNGSQPYTVEQIIDVLGQDQVELKYGASFMGRPGTKIYAASNHIIKIRTELDLNALRIREYVNHILEQEIKVGVHHPKKTWFLIEQEENKLRVGNICPRLQPLHTLDDGKTVVSDEQHIKFLILIYFEYFRIATAFQLRLDEGLSNFGIDEDNQLYYLDDDIYSWDNFVSFTHVFGVLIRGNQWVNEGNAVFFAKELVKIVNKFFSDTHTPIMLAGMLKEIYVPDINRRKVMDIIISQFQSRQTISRQLKSKDQYLAIFADIHSNLPALETVLNFLQKENITQGIVLGDTVGYGPHPEECIQRIQETDFHIIKGNHDHAAVTGDTKRGMSSTASWCIDWTIPRLNSSQLEWLEKLPLEISGGEDFDFPWLARHGAPMDPKYFYAYVYEMTYEKNLDFMANKDIGLCFHGHSHVKGVFARNKAGLDRFYNADQQSLDMFKHSMICPGSVGQPRDGSVGAQLAIYDQKNRSIQFLTLDYSMDSVLEDLKYNCFPESLVTRLKVGN